MRRENKTVIPYTVNEELFGCFPFERGISEDKNAIVFWLCQELLVQKSCRHITWGCYFTCTSIFLIGLESSQVSSKPKPWLYSCCEYRGCFTTLLYIYIYLKDWLNEPWKGFHHEPTQVLFPLFKCWFDPTRGEPASGEVRRSSSVRKHKFNGGKVMLGWKLTQLTLVLWGWPVDLPFYGSNLPKCRSCGFSVYVYVWYISIWIYVYVPFLLGKLFQHHLSNDVLMMVYSTCFYFGGDWHGRNVRNLLSPGRFPSGSVAKTEPEAWNLCFSRPRACYKWRELICPTTLGNQDSKQPYVALENFRAFSDVFDKPPPSLAGKLARVCFFSFYGVVFFRSTKKLMAKNWCVDFLMGNPTVTTRKSPEKSWVRTVDSGQWWVFLVSIGGERVLTGYLQNSPLPEKPGHIFLIFRWWGFCKTNSDNFYVRPSSWVWKMPHHGPLPLGKSNGATGWKVTVNENHLVFVAISLMINWYSNS